MLGITQLVQKVDITEKPKSIATFVQSISSHTQHLYCLSQVIRNICTVYLKSYTKFEINLFLGRRDICDENFLDHLVKYDKVP